MICNSVHSVLAGSCHQCARYPSCAVNLRAPQPRGPLRAPLQAPLPPNLPEQDAASAASLSAKLRGLPAELAVGWMRPRSPALYNRSARRVGGCGGQTARRLAQPAPRRAARAVFTQAKPQKQSAVRREADRTKHPQ